MPYWGFDQRRYCMGDNYHHQSIAQPNTIFISLFQLSFYVLQNTTFPPPCLRCIQSSFLLSQYFHFHLHKTTRVVSPNDGGMGLASYWLKPQCSRTRWGQAPPRQPMNGQPGLGWARVRGHNDRPTWREKIAEALAESK